ncbi:hypothetical protein Niako_3141 [Niastella koreensis GR20-10]|uniref:Uncharacterized protein n=1 Tax=Niastella koreensis (strain DSM 17620 / KACC 11465 / NBRC 106392 / GR20-10) TaxID=700598 RepID=G8TFN2_NIAKG|nr:hypothetical protein [Niastella koreensis]AEV99471.1 hypothetical protein Niako_3141 [Niastella koreensis GR20-10]
MQLKRLFIGTKREASHPNQSKDGGSKELNGQVKRNNHEYPEPVFNIKQQLRGREMS